MKFIMQNWGAISTALLVISETLALSPKIKANSVFQLLTNLLKNKK